MAKIFLSYTGADEIQVREIYRRLRVEGYQPWMDKEDLLPGQLWEWEIPKALRASDFILIFFSKNSVTRRGFIQREYKLALDTLQDIPKGMIHTIPVRLDECNVPEEFRHLQWVDLSDTHGFERILRAIKAGLSEREPSGSTNLQTQQDKPIGISAEKVPQQDSTSYTQDRPPISESLESSDTKDKKRWWINPTLTAAIIGAIATIAGAIIQSLPPKPGATSVAERSFPLLNLFEMLCQPHAQFLLHRWG